MGLGLGKLPTARTGVTTHCAPQGRTGGVPPILDRARRLTEPVLRAAVAGLHPRIGAVAGYHLGWCDPQGAPLTSGGGKGVCLALAVLSAEVAGGDGAVAVPGAAAVELVHNFSHLHDDVMDGDAQRRHRDTVWRVFGTGWAILAGDALLTLAQQILIELGTPAGTAAAESLAGAVQQMCYGQAEDLAFERRPLVGEGVVSLDEYRAMAGGKTGALYACAASIGALLAGASPHTVQALRQAGHHLGLVAQLADDINGIWGDPTITGKPVHSDLRALKKSLPILAALASGADESRQLAALLKATPLEEADLRLAAELVERAGGWAATVEEADRQLRRVHDHLEGVPMADELRAEIAGLARFVRHRQA